MRLNFRSTLEQVGVFPGSLGNFGGIQNAIPVVTVELPSALRTPTDAEMHKMWRDLRTWKVQTQQAKR
jgi:protein MpaA